MKKKTKEFHVRCYENEYKLYKNIAEREGVSFSSLVNKVLVDYVNKDMNVQNELLASNNRLISDVRKVQNELVLLYNTMYAFVHTFFCAFPERCVYEFSDKNTTEQDVHLKAAKKLMNKWREKLLSNKQFLQASLADTDAKINSEVVKNGE